MFYVFQMNNGRWHVDAYTSAPARARLIAYTISGSETRAEANAKADAARHTYTSQEA